MPIVCILRAFTGATFHFCFDYAIPFVATGVASGCTSTSGWCRSSGRHATAVAGIRPSTLADSPPLILKNRETLSHKSKFLFLNLPRSAAQCVHQGCMMLSASAIAWTLPKDRLCRCLPLTCRNQSDYVSIPHFLLSCFRESAEAATKNDIRSGVNHSLNAKSAPESAR